MSIYHWNRLCLQRLGLGKPAESLMRLRLGGLSWLGFGFQCLEVQHLGAQADGNTLGMGNPPYIM